jgi:DnaK suppressor protein
VDAQHAAQALNADREAALAQLGAASEQIREIVAAAESSNLDDEHDPEGATIAFERAQISALRQQARDRLAEIDDALHRLDAGTYGRCEQCGSVIPDVRLAARPASRDCVGCAGRHR